MGEPRSWADSASTVIGVLTSVGMYISLTALWYKRRSARRNQKDALDDNLFHVGNAEDLARAEAAVRSHDALEELDELLQTHVLIARYNTQHGFTERYMIDLVNKFKLAGLELRYILRPTAPLGAIGAIETPGIYELYVPFDEREMARRILPG